MLNKIKNNKDIQRISKNIVSLALVNGTILLSPLLVIPYLLRVVGSEYYGMYIFAWTFVGYFIVLVNYGYDFYATKEIAINKEDKQFVSKFFFDVSFSRLLLALISFVIIAILTFTVQEFYELKWFIICGLGVILGQAIHPTWLYQGMEDMKYITIITVVTRLVPIFLIFIFVREKADTVYVMLFQSVGYIIGGLCSCILAMKHYKLKFYLSSLADIFKQLKLSFYLFLTTVGTTLYRDTNVVILGLVTNNFTVVGYYSIADKFIRLFQMTITPIVQALYPYFGGNFAKNKELAYKQMNKLAVYFIAFLAVLSVFIFIFSDLMIKIYVGESSPNISLDLKIMSLILLFSGLSYLYGVSGLVNIGKEKTMTLFVAIVGGFNVVSCSILSHYILDVGAAISIALAEMMLCIMIFFSFKKQFKLNE